MRANANSVPGTPNDYLYLSVVRPNSRYTRFGLTQPFVVFHPETVAIRFPYHGRYFIYLAHTTVWGVSANGQYCVKMEHVSAR